MVSFLSYNLRKLFPRFPHPALPSTLHPASQESHAHSCESASSRCLHSYIYRPKSWRSRSSGGVTGGGGEREWGGSRLEHAGEPEPRPTPRPAVQGSGRERFRPKPRRKQRGCRGRTGEGSPSGGGAGLRPSRAPGRPRMLLPGDLGPSGSARSASSVKKTLSPFRCDQ